MQRRISSLGWRLAFLYAIGLIVVIIAIWLCRDNPYVQNVVSDFITISILLATSFIAYNTRERSIRLDFFDVKQSKQMYVYLSRVYVIKSKGVDNLEYSFKGVSIPDYEATFIPHFQSLFNFRVPGTDKLEGVLQRLFLADVDLKFLASPATEAEVKRNGTFVSIGSPMYNAASLRIEEHFKPPATFSKAGGLLLNGEEIDHTPAYAFVQRIRDKQASQTVFYLAGPSWQATTAAIDYFFEHWRQLAKDHPKGESFCIIVRALVDANAQYIGVERVDMDIAGPKRGSAASWTGLLTLSLLLVGFATIRRPRR